MGRSELEDSSGLCRHRKRQIREKGDEVDTLWSMQCTNAKQARQEQFTNRLYNSFFFTQKKKRIFTDREKQTRQAQFPNRLYFIFFHRK